MVGKSKLGQLGQGVTRRTIEYSVIRVQTVTWSAECPQEYTVSQGVLCKKKNSVKRGVKCHMGALCVQECRVSPGVQIVTQSTEIHPEHKMSPEYSVTRSTECHLECRVTRNVEFRPEY